jgi:hypothetical protein
MAHLGTRLLIGALAAFLPACDDEERCPASVDALLAKVEQSAPRRATCGSFNVVQIAEIHAALDCLMSADGVPASAREFSVTRCIDCFIQSTYVATSEGELLHVFIEADAWGDDRREVKVERCSSLVADEFEGVRCEGAESLYACEDALPRSR